MGIFVVGSHHGFKSPEDGGRKKKYVFFVFFSTSTRQEKTDWFIIVATISKCLAASVRSYGRFNASDGNGL